MQKDPKIILMTRMTNEMIQKVHFNGLVVTHLVENNPKERPKKKDQNRVVFVKWLN
jgi:hypothetical protein